MRGLRVAQGCPFSRISPYARAYAVHSEKAATIRNPQPSRQPKPDLLQPSEPLKRRTYQGISSGRFSAQMIRNWDSDMYAHSMVNANIKFDRS